MSYLIKWKLEKLLKRRDFGEITLKLSLLILAKIEQAHLLQLREA